MSSIANPQFEPPNNDELVAYLDGELPPEECRVVEERLANDESYRQKLRDLDQAWEALARPPATVDDSFARTTIELACVQAEDELTQQKSLVAVETRNWTLWWIGGALATALFGFILARAVSVHRSNALLADLPVIQQANVLSRVENVDFLRQLSKSVSLDELKEDPRKEKDDTAYQRELENFRKLNADSLAERRDWVESLPAEQKALLAERTRVFEDRHQSPEERGRLRVLEKDISRDPSLEQTLIAYSQWLGRQNARKLEELQEKMQHASTTEQVTAVREMVQQEYEQAARHLSEADAKRLRTEFLALAAEKRAELVKDVPAGRERDILEHVDVSKPKGASYVFFQLLKDPEKRRDAAKRLLSSLSPETQAHYEQLRGRRDREAMWQLTQWIDDALRPSWGQPELERFFEEKLSDKDRQQLLDMPRLEMKSRLEQMYVASELGADPQGPLLRDFGDGLRGLRNGRGAGPPGGDHGPGFGPGGPPPREPRFNRDRPEREEQPGGRRGPRPGDRPDDRPFGPRGHRPPDDGPPPDGPPPERSRDDEPPPPPSPNGERPI